jgi:hypothetical protein
LTFALLLASHLGSGVRADYILIQNPGNQLVEQRPLFTASIFSSVKELWHNESYPLAIFICVASITWPYIKLLLSVWAWMASYSTSSSSSSSSLVSMKRRETLLEVLDSVGKWSFVDIIVFVEIMVAFRSTIILSPLVALEIVIVPEWGFYGFVRFDSFRFVGPSIVVFGFCFVLFCFVLSSF